MFQLSRRRQSWTLAALAVAFVAVIPVAAQGNGSVKPGTTEAPDPGFPHNMVGRNIGDTTPLPGQIGIIDTGTYCGPLPSSVCYDSSYGFILNDDVFFPSVWQAHSGNAFAVRRSSKKGWPLQTITVLFDSGEPVAKAKVRFFDAGYFGRGIRGQTDENGRFQIAVKPNKRNHRFVIDVFGYQQARVDVMGRGVESAEHQVVVEKISQQEQRAMPAYRVETMGSTALPGALARDYRKALRAVEKEEWRVAITELATLVERWPVGTLESGEDYSPRQLLVAALVKAGEPALADEVMQRSFAVSEVKAIR